MTLIFITPIIVIPALSRIRPTLAYGVLDEVYLLGAGADDNNDGETAATPVSTFEKAKSLVAPGGIIYLGGQLDIPTGDTTFSLENSGGDPGVLMRRSDYAGIMINLANSSSSSPKNLTLEDIIIDGNQENITADESIIFLGSYNIVNVNSGAILRDNNKNAGYASAISGRTSSLISVRATININGGIIENNSSTTNGGGIYLSSGTINFNYGRIGGNSTGGSGVGIFIVGTGSGEATRATLYIGDGAIIENNSTVGTGTRNGGGVYAGNYSDIVIDGGIIRNNRAIQGGGIYMNSQTGTFKIISGTIQYNTATGGTGGGGIFINQATLDIQSAIIRNNSVTTTGSSGGGGGIYATNSATVNLGDPDHPNENNNLIYISNNTSSIYGGGLYVNSGATINIYSGTISDNEAKGYGGGGINTSTGGTTYMYGGLFSGNRATGSSGRGGAIYNSSQVGTKTEVLGGTIDSTNYARDGVSNGVYVSAINTISAIFHLGDAEILSNVYLGSTANGDISANIVTTITQPILFYVHKHYASASYEGRIVAVGEDGYTLTQSDIDNILIQVAPNAGTWYVKLDENDQAVLTATPPNNQLDIVFIDGVNGNDSAAGNSYNRAVRTFAEARRRLIRDGEIYIVDTISISNTQAWELPPAAFGKVVMHRYNGSLGGSALTSPMVEVTSTGNLSLTNVLFDGGGLGTSPIVVNEGILSVAGLTMIGEDGNDGGAHLASGKIITIAGDLQEGTRLNIESIAESETTRRIVGTQAGVAATDTIAAYFHYLPIGVRVIPDQDNYILDGAITATSEGISNVISGEPLQNAKIIYNLVDGEFAPTINPDDFAVSGLPTGISAGTAIRTSDTTVEIPLSGTPIVVSDIPIYVILPTTIPAANITDALDDIPVTGTLSVYPIKYVGAEVTAPTLIGTTLGPETFSAIAEISGANPGAQTLEYAIGSSNTLNPSDLVWSPTGTFTHLIPEATYYVYARAAKTSSYYAGAAQVSLPIVTPSLSTIAVSLTSVTIDLDPGAENSSYSTISVKTANPTGYSVSYHSQSSSLVCPETTYSFSSISSSGTLTQNSWGWNISDYNLDPATPSSWLAIPTTNTSVVNTSSPSENNGTASDRHLLWFGVKANWDNSPCGYQTTITITALAN